MKKLIAFLIMFMLAFTASAQPAWARGIQVVNANQEECLLRAKNALVSEGYTNITNGSDYYAGYKGIYSTVIACNASGNGKTVVNIFVATVPGDANIPSAERIRLQGYMDRSRSNNTSGNTSADNSNNNIIYAAWTSKASTYRGKSGVRFTFNFPPGGNAAGSIWGTDIYTDDSSIGVAAVHAGLISFQNGGTVTIEIREGQPSYQSSSRNGVNSNRYGKWSRSFVFVK